MILRKLRKRKELSQEQLALMAGLNVRTIQRIECGRRASLESLKALAAALEVSVTILEQDLIAIDKTAEKCKSLPLLFRLNFLGSNIGWFGLSRKDLWLRGEKQVALFAVALLPFAFFDHGFIVGVLFMLCIAYFFSYVIRKADQYRIW